MLYKHRRKPFQLAIARYREWDKACFQPSYSPNEEADGIRLLVLEPGQGADPIRCRLEHVAFSENPDYEALCYVWGDFTKINHIHFDGGTVRVRQSLYEALQALRKTDEQRVLWTDALPVIG
ncbi:hypothetical protein BDV34DRAFT_224156 [Aspergillus parasiticus]|uniref:Heterokaryon incompatibility domain-containing protein n=1 Tax=Aspergillus parasiticus TaxID=5067 RepID=A0A5N6DNI3_ASPPA|nr:hypothetical protein BDV34DRAFT_224156 [Aspergillus parasiticus]